MRSIPGRSVLRNERFTPCGIIRFVGRKYELCSDICFRLDSGGSCDSSTIATITDLTKLEVIVMFCVLWTDSALGIPASAEELELLLKVETDTIGIFEFMEILSVDAKLD